MSNSHPFFVEVRRSSGQKEWMPIEKLEALNKQRSFKRKKYKKPIKHGWNFVEYEALNEEFSSRAKRPSEKVVLMRELWGNQVVDFDGKHHRVDDVGLNPFP